MKTTWSGFAAVCALALSGCYAQLEEKTLVVTNPIQTANGPITIPGIDIGVTLPAIAFVFDLGDITVDESTKDSKLSVNSASLVMSTGNGDFEGISIATLAILSPGDPSLTPLRLTYERSRGDRPDTLTCPPTTPTSPPCLAGQPVIRLKPVEEVNLLSYVQAKQLRMELTLSVERTPTQAWTGAVELDLNVLAKVTFP